MNFNKTAMATILLMATKYFVAEFYNSDREGQASEKVILR